MDGKGSNSGGSTAGGGRSVGNGNQGSGSANGGGGGGVMKAPGGGGAYISRDSFESNPKGYFSNLHGNQQGK